DALCARGIVPGKSLKAAVELTSVQGLEGSTHFWRGCVDGDGSVGLASNRGELIPYINLVGMRPLLEQFAAFVQTICPQFRGQLYRKSSIWEVRASRHMALPVIRALYSGERPVLLRKLKRAREALLWQSRRRCYREITLEMIEEAKRLHGTWKRAAQ